MNIQKRTLFYSIPIIGILIIAGLITFNNFSHNVDVTETSAPEDDLSTDVIFADINGDKVLLDTLKNNSIIEFNQLYIHKNVPIQFYVNTSMIGDIDISIDGEKLNNRDNGIISGDITFSQLAKDNLIPIDISYGHATRKYYIRTLPENFQELNFQGKTNADKGKFYYANQYAGFENFDDIDFDRDNYIVKYDNKGNVVFYKRDHNLELVNFNRFDTEDGFSGYYYFQQNDEGLDKNYQPFRKGEMIILDDDYNIIDTIVPQRTQVYNKDYPKVEIHDFEVLGKNHYLMFDSYDGYSEQYGIQKQEIYLQEIHNGQVVWEWYSGDHEMFNNAKVNEEVTQQNIDIRQEEFLDNIHMNSIDIDPKDGNIVISNRNMNNIVKIDKETGNIIWVFGGDDNEFDFNGLEPFIRQHDAHYNDKGQLILYDNAVIHERSRGLILDIDEESKKVLDYQEFSDGNQKAIFTGNIEQLDNGFVFINWGVQKSEPTVGTIFNKEGNVVKRIIPSDNTQIETYRIYVNNK